MESMSYNGFPNEVIAHNADYKACVSVETDLINDSNSHLFTGDLTNYMLVTPPTEHKLYIKAITIVGDGVTGTVKVFRQTGNKCILPCYMSSKNSQSTSNRINLKLDINEGVYITTTSRGTSETFVGITYVDVDPTYVLIP